MTAGKKGRVYLVGAGPGDPGLLTIKGKECLSLADVIIYDYLANRAFLEYAGKDAELIYAGKKGGSHTMSQEEISGLMVDRARKGAVVVRLKGGDPFIFGRGGEEAQELARAGVDFEVIPGVSSAIAVPACAGIPLTHRGYASTVAFVTGHEDPEKKDSVVDWDKLAKGAGTLVILMGVRNLPQIVQELMAGGRPAGTRVAVIRTGTTPEQKTVVGTLGDIVELADKSNITSPAIIVVGDVVGLREELEWFEKRPLFGKRVVVTRARVQASSFVKALSRLGADCIEFPTIEVVDPESWSKADRAIKDLGSYQWLLFTSSNGVKYFVKRLEALGKDVRDLKGLKIGAIGPKTAEAWHRLGIRPDLIPTEYRAEAVAACFREMESKGIRILLPRAARAREVLPEELNGMGFQVDVVPVYRTIKPDYDTDRVRGMLEKGAVDMVTFTSSSTVTNFFEMFEEKTRDLKKWMSRVIVACIGPVTAETARKKGLSVGLIPREYTIESLTESIVEYFTAEHSG
jgi:uroporphyrinogen III methyltransferase/synthase